MRNFAQSVLMCPKHSRNRQKQSSINSCSINSSKKLPKKSSKNYQKLAKMSFQIILKKSPKQLSEKSSKKNVGYEIFCELMKNDLRGMGFLEAPIVLQTDSELKNCLIKSEKSGLCKTNFVCLVFCLHFYISLLRTVW